jgi:hypothetical protein
LLPTLAFLFFPDREKEDATTTTTRTKTKKTAPTASEAESGLERGGAMP